MIMIMIIMTNDNDDCADDYFRSAVGEMSEVWRTSQHRHQ
jgi:hypothetical protein